MAEAPRPARALVPARCTHGWMARRVRAPAPGGKSAPPRLRSRLEEAGTGLDRQGLLASARSCSPAALGERGAGSLTPSPALLRRPLRRGPCVRFPPACSRPPRGTCGGPCAPGLAQAPLHAAGCAATAAAVFAAAAAARRGGRGLGRPELGGRDRAAPAPPGSLRNLVAPRPRATKRRGRGTACNVPGTAALSLLSSPPAPFS